MAVWHVAAVVAIGSVHNAEGLRSWTATESGASRGCYGCAATMPTSRATQAELQEQLDAALARHRVPGAVAGVVLGARDLVAAAGVTSVDDPLPVTDTTLFMVGSTTKTFTATTLMNLVEQRRVSLDDRVVDHLPKFRLRDRAATRALTVRHLITHTGGWDGDIALETGWGDDALARYVQGLRDQPQVSPPGAVWAYNNAGFCVAGRIIEVAAGCTYEQAVSDLVLQPLGMQRSFFSPLDVLTRRAAVGHSSAGRAPEVQHTWGLYRSLAPAGGLASTVRDQLTWARFHLGDGRTAAGRRLLRARTMRLMQSDLVEAGAIADHCGVSWLIGDTGGVRTVGHGGNVSNLQLSSFVMAPSRGFAVTVLTNAGGGRGVCDDVERWALRRYLGAERPAPVFVDVDKNSLAGYAGAYVANYSRIEITVRGSRLLLSQGSKPVELGLVAPDRVAVRGAASLGTRGEFLRNGRAGAVQWFRWGGRVHRRVGATTESATR